MNKLNDVSFWNPLDEFLDLRQGMDEMDQEEEQALVDGESLCDCDAASMYTCVRCGLYAARKMRSEYLLQTYGKAWAQKLKQLRKKENVETYKSE